MKQGKWAETNQKRIWANYPAKYAGALSCYLWKFPQGWWRREAPLPLAPLSKCCINTMYPDEVMTGSHQLRIREGCRGPMKKQMEMVAVDRDSSQCNTIAIPYMLSSVNLSMVLQRRPNRYWFPCFLNKEPEAQKQRWLTENHVSS